MMYRVLTIVLLLQVLTTSLSIGGVDGGVSYVPPDVKAFKEQRDSCDHFRGEPVYSEERRRFLVEMIEELCVGTDAELARLKEKYKDDKLVSELLSEYEIDIEPEN